MYAIQVKNDQNRYWQILMHCGNLESAQESFRVADGLLWYTKGKVQVRVITEAGKVLIEKTTISYMD